MHPRESRQKMGFFSTVGFIVGYVVGISIFSLVGPLAFTTGPGLWVSYLMAGVPALFMCAVSAQLGSTLPVRAGPIMYSSAAPLAPSGDFWGDG